jgi:hypothetical protein
MIQKERAAVAEILTVRTPHRSPEKRVKKQISIYKKGIAYRKQIKKTQSGKDGKRDSFSKRSLTSSRRG